MARGSRKTKTTSETTVEDVEVVETEATPEAVPETAAVDATATTPAANEPEAPVAESAGVTKTGTSLSDYEKRLPEGFDKKQARVLAQNFHVGRAYSKGALVLISDEPIAGVTSSPDILVLDSGIAATLEFQGVIEPLPEA